MNRIEFWFKKHLGRILRIEILTFLIFIIITLFFNLDKNSQQYFNNPDAILNFQGLFAIIVTVLFGIFLFFNIIFPFLFLIKFFLILKFKVLSKGKSMLLLIIVILYFGSILSVFSLYSIKQHQNIINKK